MSDPFRDASTPPLDDVNQRKLDEFTTQKLSNYVAEEFDVRGRDLPESSVKPAAAQQHPLDRQPSANMKKTEFSKGKTPVHATTKVPQTPVRKSPRTSTKRKIYDGSLIDSDEHSPTPLTKKSKTGKVTARASRGNARIVSPANLGKKIAPVTKISATSSSSHAGSSKKRPKTPKPDYDENSDSEAPLKAKKTKKKNASEEEFKGFEATTDSDGKGSSASRPDHAVLDVPWKCANRMCTTGMTWFKRGDGTGSNGYGRKACSHWFGRNKKETGYIHDEVWHWFCRKCYQRAQYQAKSNKANSAGNASVKQHVETLRMQIIRLQYWRPDAVFNVQLFKGAKTRLAEYHKALHRFGASESDAIHAVKFVPEMTSKGKEKKARAEQEFPIKLIEHFDYTYAGKNKTYKDLIEICTWVDELNEAGDAPCDPPVEFLPSAEAEGETVIDPIGPPDNYDRWTTYCDEDAQDSQAGDEDNDDDDNSDDGTVGDGLTDANGGDDSSLSDSDEDNSDGDAPAARKAPLRSSSGLKATELGKQLGLAGRAGIVRGSGIRAEREANQAVHTTESATSESSEVEVKREED